MKTRKIAVFAALMLSCVLCLAFAVGCAGPQANSPEAKAQQENRQYMTSVNQTMDTLGGQLDEFASAVAQGDVVTMKARAAEAGKTVDALSKIDAPEAMKDIQDQYVQGCGVLKQALDAYVALFAEVDSATDSHPFNFNDYGLQLEEIQALYDEGMAALAAADEAASQKE